MSSGGSGPAAGSGRRGAGSSPTPAPRSRRRGAARAGEVAGTKLQHSPARPGETQRDGRDATPRRTSGAIRRPIVSSRSKKALGTTARPSRRTQMANTWRTAGSSGVRYPKAGAPTNRETVISAPRNSGGDKDGAVGPARVPHQVVGQAEVAHGGGDGDDAQGQLVEAVPVRKDQPGEDQLGAEAHQQPGELDGVGRERRAQDALLGANHRRFAHRAHCSVSSIPPFKAKAGS